MDTSSRRRCGWALLGVGVIVAGCSRGGGIGPDEAVELLVLDGLERRVAECVVSAVDGQVSLPEVAGVEVDLDSDELDLLLKASASCRPAVDGRTEGTFGGASAAHDLQDIEGSDPREDIDVTSVVADLLRGGYDPDLAVCVATSLLQAPDAAQAVSDETRKIDALLTCESLVNPSG